MSQVLLIVASVLVLGFAAFAIGYSIHTKPSGAKRLGAVAGLAAGCAVGSDGHGVVQGVFAALATGLAALAAYARWRERERERLTRPSSI